MVGIHMICASCLIVLLLLFDSSHILTLCVIHLQLKKLTQTRRVSILVRGLPILIPSWSFSTYLAMITHSKDSSHLRITKEIIIIAVSIPAPMVKANSGISIPVRLSMIVPKSDLVRIQLSLGS